MTKSFLQVVQVLFSEPEADLFIHGEKGTHQASLCKSFYVSVRRPGGRCSPGRTVHCKGAHYLGLTGGHLQQKWAAPRLLSFPHDLHGPSFSPKSHEQAKRCRTVKNGKLSLPGTAWLAFPGAMILELCPGASLEHLPSFPTSSIM